MNIKQALGVIGSVVRYKLGSPRPYFMNWQLTTKCNLRCVFCNIWKSTRTDELSFNDCKTVIDHLNDSGLQSLAFTGGEPLLKPCIFELAKYARDKGFLVGISTNGTLVNATTAQKLLNNFDTITISLDGLEQTHDTIRGVKGTFQKATNALTLLKSLQCKCAVNANFVLTKSNYEEVYAVYYMLKHLKIPVYIYPVAGKDFVEMSIPLEKLDCFMDWLLTESKQSSYLQPSASVLKLLPDFVHDSMPLLCDAGTLYLGIDPLGNLKICPLSPVTPESNLGSLLTDSLENISKTDRFQKALSARESCEPCFVGCTTPISVMFRSSPFSLLKEGWKYAKQY